MKAMNTLLLFIFTLFAGISFFGILFGADPYTSGALLKSLFFITLFFSAMGISTLFWLFGVSLFRGSLAFGSALRKGLLLALLITALVALEAGGILNIGNAFAVFLLVVTLEMMAMYRNRF